LLLSGKEKIFAHWQGRQNKLYLDNKRLLPDAARDKKIPLSAKMNL